MSATPQSNTPTPVNYLTPSQIAERYGFPDNLGEGVTQGIFAIAPLGQLGFNVVEVVEEIHKLDPHYAPNFQLFEVGGQTNNGQGGGELAMDATITGYYLPNANWIYIYLCTPDSFADAINQAANDGCWVTTCSFGIHTKTLLNDINTALGNAATAGMTACFAAGDSGAASGVAGNDFDEVVFPAGCPNAVAVGGTFFPKDVNPYEQVWWNYPPAGNFHRSWWASGGGVSKTFGVPDYQSSINPQQPWGDQQHGRGVPDVALPAEGNNYWYGTSCSTPSFAALVARCASELKMKLGDIHDVIYNPPTGTTPFNSITAGNNIPPSGQNFPLEGYTATQTGWDACTGMGTPNGTELVKAFSQARGLA